MCASLMSHTIGSPPILAAGSAAMKRRVLPAVLAGERISALAITEPSGGSDVASLRTTAILEGDHYVVNGEKTFITSGMRADYYSVAVRTNPADRGAGGVSLLLIERDTPGFSRTELKKMGWWASDTATLHFENCRVPAANLIGEENRGFPIVMRNFNSERLGMAMGCCAYARVAMAEAAEWAQNRETFGKPLVGHQSIRIKLADMERQIEATQAWVDLCAWQVKNGRDRPADFAMLKVQATRMLEAVAREVEGKAKVVRIDIDKSRRLATLLKVQQVPTFVVFMKGRPVVGEQGALRRRGLLAMLEPYLPRRRDEHLLEAMRWHEDYQDAYGATMPPQPDEIAGLEALRHVLTAALPHAHLDFFRGLRTMWREGCLLYTSPSPRDRTRPRMPSSS